MSRLNSFVIFVVLSVMMTFGSGDVFGQRDRDRDRSGWRHASDNIRAPASSYRSREHALIEIRIGTPRYDRSDRRTWETPREVYRPQPYRDHRCSSACSVNCSVKRTIVRENDGRIDRTIIREEINCSDDGRNFGGFSRDWRNDRGFNYEPPQRYVSESYRSDGFGCNEW